jgi:hypothetical protein
MSWSHEHGDGEIWKHNDNFLCPYSDAAEGSDEKDEKRHFSVTLSVQPKDENELVDAVDIISKTARLMAREGLSANISIVNFASDD